MCADVIAERCRLVRSSLALAAQVDPAIANTIAFKNATDWSDTAERRVAALGLQGLNGAMDLVIRAREASLACVALTHWSTL